MEKWRASPLASNRMAAQPNTAEHRMAAASAGPSSTAVSHGRHQHAHHPPVPCLPGASVEQDGVGGGAAEGAARVAGGTCSTAACRTPVVARGFHAVGAPHILLVPRVSHIEVQPVARLVVLAAEGDRKKVASGSTWLLTCLQPTSPLASFGDSRAPRSNVWGGATPAGHAARSGSSTAGRQAHHTTKSAACGAPAMVGHTA